MASTRGWSDLSERTRRLIIVSAVAEGILKAAALIDIKRRPANQIRGPNLQVSQPEKYLSEARKKAFENAMAKANTYASAAGLKLGSILEIVEEGASAPTYGVRSAGLAKSLSAVPVEAGEETLQAHVLLVVELKE